MTLHHHLSIDVVQSSQLFNLHNALLITARSLSSIHEHFHHHSHQYIPWSSETFLPFSKSSTVMALLVAHLILYPLSTFRAMTPTTLSSFIISIGSILCPIIMIFLGNWIAYAQIWLYTSVTCLAIYLAALLMRSNASAALQQSDSHLRIFLALILVPLTVICLPLSLTLILLMLPITIVPWPTSTKFALPLALARAIYIPTAAYYLYYALFIPNDLSMSSALQHLALYLNLGSTLHRVTLVALVPIWLHSVLALFSSIMPNRTAGVRR